MWKLNISRNIKIGLILLFVCALNANDRVIPEKAPFCISDFVSTISENEFLNFKSILVDDTKSDRQKGAFSGITLSFALRAQTKSNISPILILRDIFNFHIFDSFSGGWYPYFLW